MLGDPEEGQERQSFSYSEVQETISGLEKKRFLVRFAAVGSQPCFLQFNEPISVSFLQTIQEYVDPRVLTLSLRPPTSPQQTISTQE